MSRYLKVDWVVIYFSDQLIWRAKMYLLGFSLFLHIFSALLGCVWLCPEQSCMPLQNEMIIHVSIILRHIKMYILNCYINTFHYSYKYTIIFKQHKSIFRPIIEKLSKTGSSILTNKLECVGHYNGT